MPDIASVKREFYVQWLVEKRDVIDGREYVTTYYESAPATLSDIIALIEDGSEEEKAQLGEVVFGCIGMPPFTPVGHEGGICGESVIARNDVKAGMQAETERVRDFVDTPDVNLEAYSAWSRPEDHECER